MKRPAVQIALVLALAVAATGCGSSDEKKGKGIPASIVGQLDSRLVEIERRIRAAEDDRNVGACNDIQTDSFAGTGGVADLIDSVPSDVDPDIRSALEDSFARLQELTQETCAAVEPQQTDTTPAETTPPEPTTTEQTTPTETERTAPDRTTTQPDPGTGGDEGSGGPGGSGGSPAPSGEGD